MICSRDRPHRAGDGPCPPSLQGQACDFACTFIRHLPSAVVALRAQSRLMLEGRTRTFGGPSPDLSPAGMLAALRGSCSR